MSATVDPDRVAELTKSLEESLGLRTSQSGAYVEKAKEFLPGGVKAEVFFVGDDGVIAPQHVLALGDGRFAVSAPSSGTIAIYDSDGEQTAIVRLGDDGGSGPGLQAGPGDVRDRAGADESAPRPDPSRCAERLSRCGARLRARPGHGLGAKGIPGREVRCLGPGGSLARRRGARSCGPGLAARAGIRGSRYRRFVGKSAPRIDGPAIRGLG